MSYSLLLGFGNDVDYEVSLDTGVLSALTRDFGISDNDLDINTEIRDERSLVISILSHMREGRGGERFAHDPDILISFSRKFDYRKTMGGTPVRAAIAAEKLGCGGLLHYVTQNRIIRDLTPPSFPFICSAKEDCLYPHLIIQYAAGDAVCTDRINVVAPAANRMIYDHDPDNIRMEIHPVFREFFPSARAFLISGFNAMQDEVLAEMRLRQLAGMMESLPEDCVVFYEDAAFHHPEIRAVVRDTIERFVTIHSMNEDELQQISGRRINLLDVNAVMDSVRSVKEELRIRNILVHTAKWSLMQGPEASRYGDALQRGTDLAAARYVYGDDYGKKEFLGIRRYPKNKEGMRFCEELRETEKDVLYVVAYDADVPKPTTVGLGDTFVGGFLSEFYRE